MMVAVASLSFLLAAVCAALMGYAIQRGATCTVAAIGEIAENGRASRLRALAEAALWVAGGLVLARWAGLQQMLPGGFALSGWTVAGGALLGIGAYVNQACVFGSIARLGSGEWAYVLTPIGFFAGVASVQQVFGAIMPVPVPAGQFLPDWAGIVFAAYAVWRTLGILAPSEGNPRLHMRVWAPHVATLIIGVTFVILFLTVGAWAYTDLLLRLAEGMADNADWRVLLFVALLAGAMAGGWTAGRLSSTLPDMAGMLRCVSGGALMGWGSALIPGGNDGLILIGMPLLQPYAWVGILTMCATIWLAFALESRIARAKA